jgi:hypothetical protein
VNEAAMESLFLNNSGGAGNSDQAARRGSAGKQENRLLDPKRLQNVAIMLKVLNVTSADVTGALTHGEFLLSVLYYNHNSIVWSPAKLGIFYSALVQSQWPHVPTVHSGYC